MKTIMKFLYTVMGKPYLNATFSYKLGGSLGITAVFNQNAIYDIDRRYAQFNRKDYDPTLTDNEKVAMFIADMLAGLVPNRVPLNEPDDDDRISEDVIPLMKNLPVKETVDISKINPQDRMM